jgi:D-arabinose 1-dehydrogenase-like Zn-dependent alcohol dehydrogenase
MKPHGRVVFNGGIFGEIKLNYFDIMIKSLRIQGRFMYEREHTRRLIAMVEAGLVPLGETKTGHSTVGTFKLEQIQEGLELAASEPGWGKQVLLMP